jgi:hypothetical protein
MVLLAAGLVGAYFIYKQADNINGGFGIHNGNAVRNTLPDQSNLTPQYNKLLNKL